MDVFMSLLRMVIYLQSFFSQHNILQTSVTHIQIANGGRRRIFSWVCCAGAGWPVAPGHLLVGAVVHNATHSIIVTDVHSTPAPIQ